MPLLRMLLQAHIFPLVFYCPIETQLACIERIGKTQSPPTKWVWSPLRFEESRYIASVRRDVAGRVLWIVWWTSCWQRKGWLSVLGTDWMLACISTTKWWAVLLWLLSGAPPGHWGCDVQVQSARQRRRMSKLPWKRSGDVSTVNEYKDSISYLCSKHQPVVQLKGLCYSHSCVAA